MNLFSQHGARAKTYFVRLFIGVALLCGSVPAWSQVEYEANTAISANRQRAAIIHRRLTGVKAPIDSVVIKEMEALIAQGQSMEAAALATSEPGFYNNTLRHLAQRMSTVESTYKAPLTDYVATFIGIAHNSIDARELLNGNYVYSSNLTGAPLTDVANFLRSNNHYSFLEQQMTLNPNLDLASTLQQTRQQIANDGGTAVNNPDPAGVLTSRAFMEACANMGTNRRCYEEIMKKFMCVTLEDFADTSVPDNWVAIDVTRSPGGDPRTYQQSCRGCHGNMDSMRGAFAFFEFDNGQIKHGQVNGGNLYENNTRVSTKFNRGAATGYADGFRTTNSSWQNFAVTGAVGEFFGWRNETGQVESQSVRGAGLNAYGRMLANSQAFSRCLVKRTFSTVCGRDATQEEASVVRSLASDFESPAQGNRKIKWLFERVASHQSCIGR